MGSAHADRISAYAISVYEMSFHLGTYLGRTATKGMTQSEVNKSFPQSALRRPLATLFILAVSDKFISNGCDSSKDCFARHAHRTY